VVYRTISVPLGTPCSGGVIMCILLALYDAVMVAGIYPRDRIFDRLIPGLLKFDFMQHPAFLDAIL
jgi:hypothetical protein